MGKKRSYSSTIGNKNKKQKIEDLSCSCGLSGQNCIVLRRKFGDWVLEDDILKQAGLPIRKDCGDPGTKKQNKVMEEYYKNIEKQGFDSIVKRWEDDK